MYDQQLVFSDSFYMMVYGGSMIFALIACVYMLFRRSNAIAPEVTPPLGLRRWVAVFFGIMLMSHISWYILVKYGHHFGDSLLCIIVAMKVRLFLPQMQNASSTPSSVSRPMSIAWALACLWPVALPSQWVTTSSSTRHIPREPVLWSRASDTPSFFLRLSHRGPHRPEKPPLRLVRSGCKGTNFSEDMVVVIIFICTFVPKFTNEGYGSEKNTEISAPGDGQ